MACGTRRTTVVLSWETFLCGIHRSLAEASDNVTMVTMVENGLDFP